MRISSVVFLSLLLPQEPPRPDAVSLLSASIDAGVSKIAGTPRSAPAPVCDDGEFLRRVMLDLVGYPPNADQVSTFRADVAENKRAARVDQLLATDLFSDFWARRWCDVLVGDYHRLETEPLKSAGPEERERVMAGFRDWLRLRIAGDLPWSDTVREILEAEGGVAATPAVAYKLAHHEHPRVPYFEGQVSRHFLGVNLSCTGCHDSAFDKWRVEDGYAMAAFSTGRKIFRDKGILTVSEKPVPADRPIPGDKGVVPMFQAAVQVMKPKFFTGGVPREGEVLAKAFARFVTGPENLQLRNAAVNRVWSWLMGRGIVMPVEDFNLKNKPLSKDLLEALAIGFADGKHSMKLVIRAICGSAAYQRRCDGEQPLTRVMWNRTPIRPLSAEQLLNSIDVATQGKPASDRDAARRLARRILSPEAAACETVAAPAQVEGLAWLADSDEVWSKIRDGAVLLTVRTGMADPVARTKAMFLAALSRDPTGPELERHADFLRLHGDEGLAQAYWALLQSTEFRMRH